MLNDLKETLVAIPLLHIWVCGYANLKPTPLILMLFMLFFLGRYDTEFATGCVV